jgi:hypothetical protein
MKKIKKIILSCLAILLLIVIGYYTHYFIYYVKYDAYKEVLATCDYKAGKEFVPLVDSDNKIANMVLVSESEELKLYTNTATAEIAIYDKRTSEVTYSNPVDADDDTATGINKSFLKSQVIIDYYNDKRTVGTMNSYDMSTKNGRFTSEGIDNGIRYIYTFGDLGSPTGIIPVYIKAERLQIYLDKMQAVDARNIKGRYTESKTIDGFLELTSASKKKSTLTKMTTIFEGVGYTVEDYQNDMAAASGTEEELVTFTIAIEYQLEKDSLVVTVPTGKIEETGGAKIYNLQLLRYFGAANKEETGYMVVPNGSGSLINFNNGKISAPTYLQYVYGIDPLSTDFSVVENTEDARLPIFGVKKEESAYIGVIENGDALGIITADVAGKLNGYNYVYPTFLLRGTEKLAMFGTTGQGSDLPVVESEIYKLDIKVRYSFMEKEDASYAGMANYLRNDLLSKGILDKNEEEESIPFYVDIIGGVKQTEHFLGIPYHELYKATTFKEAGIIADSLYALGITNLRMNYEGWFNGGFYHDVPDKITGVSKLGGKKELEKLSDKIEEKGGKLFIDVAFQKVTYISKRYRYQVESSKYYGGGFTAIFGQVNPVTLRNLSALGYRETLYNLISPKFITRYVEKFVKAIDKYEITGIALRDLGDTLHSDKKRTNVINREEAKCVIQDQLRKVDSTGKDVIVNGGNFYSLGYIDEIMNMPLTHNAYYLIDEEIPFYQMIVHGTMNYTGATINLSDTYDKTDLVLRLIEYGASPHFTFTYEDSNNFKYSGMNRFYATKYDNWLEDIRDIYKEVNDVLCLVTGRYVTNHEILSDGVRKITYDNGIVLYININKNDAIIGDDIISGRSYKLLGVEK